MKNMREVVRNGLLLGGIIVGTSSAIDAIQKTPLLDDIRKSSALSYELQTKHNVTLKCIPIGFLSGNPSASCSETIKSAGNRVTEELMLEAYHQDLSSRKKDLFTNKRLKRDGLGFAGSVLVIMSGALMRTNYKRR